MKKPGRKKSGTGYTVVINTKWCKRCGICSAFCPAGVFLADDFGLPSPFREVKCTGCMQCVVLCPDFAIDVMPAPGENMNRNTATDTGDEN